MFLLDKIFHLRCYGSRLASTSTGYHEHVVFFRKNYSSLLIIKVYSWVNHFKHIVQICFVCHKMFFQERPIMQSDYFCAFLLAQVLKSFNERLNLLHIDMILRAKIL